MVSWFEGHSLNEKNSLYRDGLACLYLLSSVPLFLLPLNEWFKTVSSPTWS